MFILLIILFILVCIISVYYFYLLKKFEEDIEELYDMYYRIEDYTYVKNIEKEDKKGSVLK